MYNASVAADVDFGSTVNATAISAGGQTTCAILSNKKLICFGNGQDGELVHSFQYTHVHTHTHIYYYCLRNQLH
jgi:Regulator of chromosome condensation (RCC1) repeat